MDMKYTKGVESTGFHGWKTAEPEGKQGSLSVWITRQQARVFMGILAGWWAGRGQGSLAWRPSKVTFRSLHFILQMMGCHRREDS